MRQAEHWVEFDTGLTRLALHARPADQQHPEHAQQPIAWTIETDDLDATVEDLDEKPRESSDDAVAEIETGRFAGGALAHRGEASK